MDRGRSAGGEPEGRDPDQRELRGRAPAPRVRSRPRPEAGGGSTTLNPAAPLPTLLTPMEPHPDIPLMTTTLREADPSLAGYWEAPTLSVLRGRPDQGIVCDTAESPLPQMSRSSILGPTTRGGHGMVALRPSRRLVYSAVPCRMMGARLAVREPGAHDMPLRTMRTRLHLKPGQKGTKQLLPQYCDRLVCVRHRYEAQCKKRFKAVE